MIPKVSFNVINQAFENTKGNNEANTKDGRCGWLAQWFRKEAQGVRHWRTTVEREKQWNESGCLQNWWPSSFQLQLLTMAKLNSVAITTYTRAVNGVVPLTDPSHTSACTRLSPSPRPGRESGLDRRPAPPRDRSANRRADHTDRVAAATTWMVGQSADEWAESAGGPAWP